MHGPQTLCCLGALLPIDNLHRYMHSLVTMVQDNPKQDEAQPAPTAALRFNNSEPLFSVRGDGKSTKITCSGWRALAAKKTAEYLGPVLTHLQEQLVLGESAVH